MRFFNRKKETPVETPEQPAVEERQNPPAGTYTDAIVEAIQNTAAGGKVSESPTVTAALEICASLYSRALASAKVEGDNGLLKPHILADIGRDLIRYGESLWYPYLSFNPRKVKLLHSNSWDVTGGSIDPDTWQYSIHLATPDGEKSQESVKKDVDNAAVFHFKYATEASRPWKGVAPLQWASSTGKFMAIVENCLKEETSGTRGYILPVSNMGKQSIDQLKADVSNLGGKTALVGASFGVYAGNNTPGNFKEFTPSRIGPNYPAQVVTLHQNLIEIIVLACGIPITLTKSEESTGLREAWRQFLHGSISPVASMIQDELSEKLKKKVTLDFTELYAADVQGRARAYHSLVQGNMSVTDAAEKTGFGKVQENIKNPPSPAPATI